MMYGKSSGVRKDTMAGRAPKRQNMDAKKKRNAKTGKLMQAMGMGAMSAGMMKGANKKA